LTDKQSASLVTKKLLSGTVALKDLEGKQRSAKQRLPRFISHPNGIILRVFKRQQSIIHQQRVCAKQRSPSSSVPSLICHPNGIILQVLNQ